MQTLHQNFASAYNLETVTSQAHVLKRMCVCAFVRLYRTAQHSKVSTEAYSDSRIQKIMLLQVSTVVCWKWYCTMYCKKETFAFRYY